jgi:GT2 family glycosyltransferase
MTDAGCIAKKDWLEKLIKPFTIGKVDVSAGFYKMTGGSNLQKAESVFLGVRPTKYNSDFLPSTRSIAFTKKMWKKAGGFPEDLKGTAEDTVFNYKLIKVGAKISRVKDAIVEWGMPTSISNFQFSIYNYAKGDAESKIWFFPGTGLASHNIKALSVVFRYLAGLVLFFLFLSKPVLLLLLFILVILYLIWSFRKIYLQFRDWKVAIWGPVLQVVSDFAVMGGFISGIIS